MCCLIVLVAALLVKLAALSGNLALALAQAVRQLLQTGKRGAGSMNSPNTQIHC